MNRFIRRASAVARNPQADIHTFIHRLRSEEASQLLSTRREETGCCKDFFTAHIRFLLHTQRVGLSYPHSAPPQAPCLGAAVVVARERWLQLSFSTPPASASTHDVTRPRRVTSSTGQYVNNAATSVVVKYTVDS